MKPFVVAAIALAVHASAALCSASTDPAAPTVAWQVPMDAAHWQVLTDFAPAPNTGQARFATSREFPSGELDLRKGGVLLKDFFFEGGTIDLDVDPAADGGIPGIAFRNRGSDGEEELYLRPESCPGAECLQYTPRIHQFLGWELYPEYQAAASIHAGAWAHLRLVISGRRMSVFVNRESRPALVVPHLEADALAGAIRLRGNARFANVVIQPGVTEGIVGRFKSVPPRSDTHLLRHLSIMAPVAFPAEGAPLITDVPRDRSWSTLYAERKGMVNLTRAYGPTDGDLTAFAWLRTVIVADRPRVVHVAMALTGEAWVFLNGKLVLADRNLWDVPAQRKPGGRFLLSNSGFELPLTEGRNELFVAARNPFPNDDLREAWAIAMRLDKTAGLQLDNVRLTRTTRLLSIDARRNFPQCKASRHDRSDKVAVAQRVQRHRRHGDGAVDSGCRGELRAAGAGALSDGEPRCDRVRRLWQPLVGRADGRDGAATHG